MINQSCHRPIFFLLFFHFILRWSCFFICCLLRRGNFIGNRVRSRLPMAEWFFRHIYANLQRLIASIGALIDKERGREREKPRSNSINCDATVNSIKFYWILANTYVIYVYYTPLDRSAGRHKVSRLIAVDFHITTTPAAMALIAYKKINRILGGTSANPLCISYSKVLYIPRNS